MLIHSNGRNQKVMNVHFIAIGGSAMHNLAIALSLNGNNVTGSDDEIFEPSKSRLRKYGLLPSSYGWYPDKLSSSIDAVILGMHAKADNPELLKAQEIGLKIYSYPEFLFNHSKDKKRIVIGGSHGKTTITAMIMHVLKDLEYDFDYLVGSKIKDFEVMVRVSDDAPLIIFEGDEYLSSPIDRRPKFHWYAPHIALISGIAWDHINVFPTMDNYIEQFDQFISIIEPKGTLIYFDGDEILKKLTDKHQSLKLIPYNSPSYEVVDSTNYIKEGNLRHEVSVFGNHNMTNMNGAKLVCNQLGISDMDFYASIAKFDGTSNRLELISSYHNSKVFKDFAHAPSKVLATVNAVKEQFPHHNVIACLELHTFSSLNKNFIHEYKDTLDSADLAAVYFNEHTIAMKQLPELSVKDVKYAFNRNDLTVFTDALDLRNWLTENKNINSIFLLMSSGNFRGLNVQELGKELTGEV